MAPIMLEILKIIHYICEIESLSYNKFVHKIFSNILLKKKLDVIYNYLFVYT